MPDRRKAPGDRERRPSSLLLAEGWAEEALPAGERIRRLRVGRLPCLPPEGDLSAADIRALSVWSTWVHLAVLLPGETVLVHGAFEGLAEGAMHLSLALEDLPRTPALVARWELPQRGVLVVPCFQVRAWALAERLGVEMALYTPTWAMTQQIARRPGLRRQARRAGLAPEEYVRRRLSLVEGQRADYWRRLARWEAERERVPERAAIGIA